MPAVLAAVAILVTAGFTVALTGVAGARVAVVADGRARYLMPWGRSVGDLLSRTGITLEPGDAVSPGVTEPVKPGMVVVVERAVPVTVLADGRRIEVRSAGMYVKDAVAQAGMIASAQDLLYPSPEAELEPGMTIAVARVKEEVVTRRVQVPFQVQKREDGNLELGTSKVIQQGKPGLKEVVLKLVRLDGKLLKTLVVGERMLQQPVAQVVALGTCGVISRGGQTIRFKKAMDVVATAYTPGPESTGASADGYTATGLRAGYGVIAVDPRVIKLGSRVYVEGYGFAVAGDTGGAIKGARIDVCFESKSEALRWGRRKVRVYLL